MVMVSVCTTLFVADCMLDFVPCRQWVFAVEIATAVDNFDAAFGEDTCVLVVCTAVPAYFKLWLELVLAV